MRVSVISTWFCCEILVCWVLCSAEAYLYGYVTKCRNLGIQFWEAKNEKKNGSGLLWLCRSHMFIAHISCAIVFSERLCVVGFCQADGKADISWFQFPVKVYWTWQNLILNQSSLLELPHQSQIFPHSLIIHFIETASIYFSFWMEVVLPENFVGVLIKGPPHRGCVANIIKLWSQCTSIIVAISMGIQLLLNPFFISHKQQKFQQFQSQRKRGAWNWSAAKKTLVGRINQQPEGPPVPTFTLLDDAESNIFARDNFEPTPIGGANLKKGPRVKIFEDKECDFLRYAKRCMGCLKLEGCWESSPGLWWPCHTIRPCSHTIHAIGVRHPNFVLDVPHYVCRFCLY